MNANGLLIEPSLNVPPDATDIRINPDGLVSVRIAGQESTTELGSISLVRFLNEAGLESLGGNLYRTTPNAGDPIEGTPGESGLGLIAQGHIEMSNVQVVEEMVNMIVAQRAFEVSSKAIQTSDEMLRTANNVR